MRGFVTDILVNGQMDKLAGYFDGDTYVQHNPQIADNLSGLGGALAGDGEAGHHHEVRPDSHRARRRELRAGGQRRHSSRASTRRSTICSASQKGKIAEHWDTIETIPAKAEWKNQNGKFGF